MDKNTVEKSEERRGSYRRYDTSLFFNWPDSEQRQGPTPYQWEHWNRICDALRDTGWEIGPSPEHEKHYPSIAKEFRRGRHGLCEARSRISPKGGEIDWFQNVVTENRNGGEYDFHKLAKMPYLIRLRYLHARNTLTRLFDSWGWQDTTKVHPNPAEDPLGWFNSHWDGEYERYHNTHRFTRGADGWPLPAECSGYGRQCVDADGKALSPGDVRYFRYYNGRLLRATVYPNMNGMWLVVYGPGRSDYTTVNSGQIFSCDPREHPRRLHPGRKQRLSALLDEAVKAQAFERAIVYRDLLHEKAQAA